MSKHDEKNGKTTERRKRHKSRSRSRERTDDYKRDSKRYIISHNLFVLVSVIIERANHLQNRLKNQKSKKGISRRVQGCRMVLVLIRMLSRSTNQMN